MVEKRGKMAGLVRGIALIVAMTLSSAFAGSSDDMDDVFTEIATSVPAFGGAFFDERGTLNVYLLDPTQKPAAERSLHAVLGREVEGKRARVLPARHGFLQLKEWHGRLGSVLVLPGVTLTDVDDARNRLRIGLEDLALHAPAVQLELARLGIPSEAVRFEQIGPFELETSLRTLHRPLAGGLQISSAAGICTLGFNALRAGVSGFVTNSHCTSVQGGVEGTVFHQPSVSGTANRVGAETVDPAYSTGGGCPIERRCRRSDSAFVRRDTNVTGSLGRIARPSIGSFAWNGTDRFRIVDQATRQIVGTAITKIGRTTGRTQGAVTAVCANLNVADTKITLLCQNTANYSSAGGDSGSPVVRIVNSPSTNDVVLYGIHWGSGGAHSPIANVLSEIGPLRSCDAAFTGPGKGCP